MSGGFGKKKDSSNSAPLTADQVASYYDKVDEKSGGKLATFAKEGTAATPYQGVSRRDFVKPGKVATGNVAYKAPTAKNIQALGGLGATRLGAIEKARSEARGESAADPSLSVFQKVRSNQLTDQDAQDRMDAIKKETEAAISGMVSESAGRDLTAQTTNVGNRLTASEINADNSIRARSRNLDALEGDATRRHAAKVDNAALRREDLEALANIFFGGKGQTTSSKGRSFEMHGGVAG